MALYNYSAWITLLTTAHQDAIISKLLTNGYMVGSADKDGSLICRTSLINPVSLVLGLRLYRMDGIDTDANKVSIDILATLHEIGAHYYSVIVSSGVDCAWIGCNFEIPPMDIPIDIEPMEEPVPKKTNNKLN